MSSAGLSRTIRTLFSQDVALRNAALASARMLRERRQRAEVDEFLARLDDVVAAQSLQSLQSVQANDAAQLGGAPR